MSIDVFTLSADAAAAWHAAWLTVLGLRSERREGVWRALDVPPFIYWTAITLAPDVPQAAVGEARGTICDAWSALALESAGFAVRMREPWFVRPPAELGVEGLPAGLEIVRVSTPAEVEEFELVSVRGFNREDASIEQGAIHPAEIFADRQMTMLTGRADGRAVAAAMSYRTEVAVGIYGVTTVASARGRGYASADARADRPVAARVAKPEPRGRGPLPAPRLRAGRRTAPVAAGLAGRRADRA